MTTGNDPAWEALGQTWRDGSENAAFSAADLRARVRRESIGMWVYGVLEGLVGVAGLAVGIGLLWMRSGISIAMGIATILFTGSVIALAVRARMSSHSGDTQTVAGMLDLTIARCHTGLRMVHATYLVSAVALGYVAAIALVDAAYSDDAATLRLALRLIAGALLFIAAFTLVAFLYGRRVQRSLDRFSEMRSQLQTFFTASE